MFWRLWRPFRSHCHPSPAQSRGTTTTIIITTGTNPANGPLIGAIFLTAHDKPVARADVATRAVPRLADNQFGVDVGQIFQSMLGELPMQYSRLVQSTMRARPSHESSGYWDWSSPSYGNSFRGTLGIRFPGGIGYGKPGHSIHERHRRGERVDGCGGIHQRCRQRGDAADRNQRRNVNWPRRSLTSSPRAAGLSHMTELSHALARPWLSARAITESSLRTLLASKVKKPSAAVLKRESEPPR
jgi:hypothetical protein